MTKKIIQQGIIPFQTYLFKQEYDPKLFSKQIPMLMKFYEKQMGKSGYRYHPEGRSFTINVPNTGGIFTQFEVNLNDIHYQGIRCHGYSEFLGFRDTKKFRNFLSSLEISLSGIAHVHTGGILIP